MPLCWTSQTKLFAKFVHQNGTFGLVRKLWTCTTNGFCSKSWLWYCIKQATHLNAGIGFPCAGHNIEKDSPILTLNEPKVSELVENFGTDIPIGSKKNGTSDLKKNTKQYLNDGSGSPWAGQVIAKLWPNDFLNADESTMDENLGLVNPIGSIEK